MKFDFLFGLDKCPRNHSLCSVASYLSHREIFANGNRHILIEYEDRAFNAWYDRVEIERECFAEGQKLLDAPFFRAYQAASEKAVEDCKRFHRQMWLADHRSRSDDELLGLFRAMNEQYTRAISYFKGSRPEFLRAVEQALQKELEAKTQDAGQIAAWTVTLTTPVGLDIIKREDIAWHRLLSRVRGNQDIDIPTALTQHILDFSWLFPEQLRLEEPLRVLHVKLEGDTRPVEELAAHVVEVERGGREFATQREALKKQLGSGRVAALADVIAWSGFQRLQIKDCWSGLSTICATLWLELARRIGEDPDRFLYYYLEDDIRTCLQRHRPLSEEDIRARQDYTLIYLNYPSLTVSHGPEARRRGKALLAETLKELETDELTGQAASPGRVQGRVRIVPLGDLETLRAAETAFQDGEIFVTQMTQPNMVPIAKRASAIVTDEGGITSHAAIISREFKIPCVVGTKIATQVLKDGDLVEVDAEQGIVRVLKREATR